MEGQPQGRTGGLRGRGGEGPGGRVKGGGGSTNYFHSDLTIEP